MRSDLDFAPVSASAPPPPAPSALVWPTAERPGLRLAGTLLAGTSPRALARELEINECEAYRSFFAVARVLHGHASFRLTEDDGVAAFMAPAVAQAGVFNRILGLGVAQPADASVVADLSQQYRRLGCGMAVDVVPELLDAETAAELRRLRIRRSVMAAVLLRRTAQAPGMPELAAPGGAGEPQVIAATGAARETVAALCAQVFEVPDTVREVLAQLSPAEGWRHWLALIDGQPAGAALSFIHQRRGWFGWAATLPQFRGRGVKGALDNARIAHAQALECEFISSDTATGTALRPDHSLLSLLRRGFETAYLRATYLQAAAA